MRNHKSRIVDPDKLSIRYKGEINVFPDKQKLRKFPATRPALQEMLNGALIPEAK